MLNATPQTMANLTDSTILRKIERQPKRSASYKQLVRELGLHGDQRPTCSINSLARARCLKLNRDGTLFRKLQQERTS
jgi:hypothetical protein